VGPWLAVPLVSGSNPKWTFGRLRKIRNLSIHDLHSGFWVTRSCRSTGGQDAINLGNVLGGQPNLQGANIILKVPPPLGAGNGNDVISLGQHPGERKLCRRATLPRGKRLHLLDEIEIPLEVRP